MLQSTFEKAVVSGPGCISIETFKRPEIDFTQQIEALGLSKTIEILKEVYTVAEIEACKRFIKPLMASATHARLYPSNAFQKHFAGSVQFLIPRKGFLEFDLSKDCVSGNEEFWRAGARDGEYRRGTIVVVQPSSFSLAGLLEECGVPGVMSSRYQILKGSSSAAVRFAERHPRISERVFLLSASNGLQLVEIYPSREGLHDDCTTALEYAARSPGARDLTCDKVGEMLS